MLASGGIGIGLSEPLELDSKPSSFAGGIDEAGMNYHVGSTAAVWEFVLSSLFNWPAQ